MDAHTAHLAAVAGALGVGVLMLGRGRWMLLAGLALLVAAEAGLVASLSGGIGLGSVSAAAATGGALAAAALLAGAAALFVRWPVATIPALLVAAPFRLPIDFDSSHQFLIAAAEPGQLGRLLPLYFVLTAAALALAWRLLRGAEARPLPLLLALPAGLFLGFAAISLTWTDDLEAARQLLEFFLLPFAGLVAVIGRSPFGESLPRVLAICALALASLFAAIGIYQGITQELLFFAPNLELSNENTEYFRVTSLFGDPSLYGRHVVLGLAVLIVLLAMRKASPAWGIPLACFLAAGLLFSYSQSSMTALVAVTLAVLAVTGGRGTRLAVGGILVAGVLVLAGVGASAAVRGDSLREATSDRSRRVEDTTRVIADHPIVGVGLGAQPRASQDRSDRDEPTPSFVSHTTPLTIAAELGAVGLALYLALLVCGVLLLGAVRRRAPALGLALAAVFLALFVHALFYSGFVEDPITWVVLAVGAAYLSASGAVNAQGRLGGKRPRATEAAETAPTTR